MLGFRHHQSLISLLDTRLNDLTDLRSKKRSRRRPLLLRSKKGKRWSSLQDRATGKLSILHVEDHKLVAHLVDELLTAEGIHVDRCASGASAWEGLKTNEDYDALVVDNNLPGLSDRQTLNFARRRSQARRAPGRRVINGGRNSRRS